MEKMQKKNIADDTWYEVFLRLPMDAIFRFKSVSKVWFSTLSCPNFISKWYKFNYASIPWALGHYANSVESQDDVRRRFTIACPDSHSQFIENRPNGFSFSFLDPNQKQKEIMLMGSSNGLVLCGILDGSNQTTYCVCNPLTQKWVSLPPPPTQDYWVTGFMCDDECFSSSLVSTSFKVVKIPQFDAAVKEFKVEMFSSELGKWNVYDVSCAQDVTWNISTYDNFVTHNGVFYWFQKRNRKILGLSIGGSTNRGICGHDCRLIDIPDPAMDGGLYLRHRLGESEGLICYAMVKERDKSLYVWVLEEDWCLLYKDDNFHDMLADMESLVIDEIGKVDFITEFRIMGFNPVDKNVVILSYDDRYIWAYNTRTKKCEQLSHPSFLRIEGSVHEVSFLTFALKPRPSVLPPVSW